MEETGCADRQSSGRVGLGPPNDDGGASRPLRLLEDVKRSPAIDGLVLHIP